MTIVRLSEWDFRDGYLKWDCPTSPSKHCEYDDEKDPAWDDCLHCHQPYERK